MIFNLFAKFPIMKKQSFKLDKKIKLLKDYFLKRPEISMAFVFGSYAKGKETLESDFDVAVYFKPEKNIEWQEDKFYPKENQIWQDVEKIIGLDTDLVILNRSKATVAFDILKTGLPVIIKDAKLFLEFYLIISREAEDFRRFIKDYWMIYERSKSLSPEDKAKLTELIHFLDIEIKEFPDYQNIDFKTYQEDKIKRRNIERWIETLVIAAIDVAKIILSSNKKKMPATYIEALRDFAIFADFSEEESKKFAQFAKLRNIIAHEYLDIRFEEVKRFIKEAEPFYKKAINFSKSLL